MTERGFAMSGMLLASDMACVRMMSTKPLTSSAVLFACSHVIKTCHPSPALLSLSGCGLSASCMLTGVADESIFEQAACRARQQC